MDIEIVKAVKRAFPKTTITFTDYSVTVKSSNVTMTIEDYEKPPYIDDTPDTFSANDAPGIVAQFTRVFTPSEEYLLALKQPKMYEGPDGTTLNAVEFQEYARELQAAEYAQPDAGASSWSDEEINDRMRHILPKNAIDELYAEYLPTGSYTFAKRIIAYIGETIGADACKVERIEPLKLRFYDIKKTKDFDISTVVAFSPIVQALDVDIISDETIKIGSKPTIFEHIITFDVGKHVFERTQQRLAMERYLANERYPANEQWSDIQIMNDINEQ